MQSHQAANFSWNGFSAEDNMASARAGSGLVGLLKRGWNEIPEVVGSGVLAIIGLSLGSYGVYLYQNKDRQYRKRYTVVRDDDPRAPKFREWELKNLEKMKLQS